MSDRTEQFEALFESHYGGVLAYAVRRCASRQDAEDVVAETFGVAWRRLDELPVGQQARLWLFGTARLVRLNAERGQRRQRRVAQRLAHLRPDARGAGDVAADVAAQDRLQRAFTRLREPDREILRLVAWEQLSAEEIAVVLETSTAAVWKRLQRARQRLAGALDPEPEVRGDVAASDRKATS